MTERVNLAGVLLYSHLIQRRREPQSNGGGGIQALTVPFFLVIFPNEITTILTPSTLEGGELG